MYYTRDIILENANMKTKTSKQLLEAGFEYSCLPVFGNLVKFNENSIVGYNVNTDGTCYEIKEFIAENDYAMNSIKKWKAQNEENKEDVLSGRGRLDAGRYFSRVGGIVKMNRVGSSLDFNY